LKDNPQAKDLIDALARLQKSTAEIGEGSSETPGIGPLNRDISRYFVMVESADIKPGPSAHQAANEGCVALQKKFEAWRKFNQEDVPAMNKLLRAANLTALPAAGAPAAALTCGP